jgi:hypothetical protein
MKIDKAAPGNRNRDHPQDWGKKAQPLPMARQGLGLAGTGVRGWGEGI